MWIYQMAFLIILVGFDQGYLLKREDKRQMTSQSGHGFLSIFFGGKYDLIQLHRQIIHQNARNFFFTTKLSSPPAISI